MHLLPELGFPADQRGQVTLPLSRRLPLTLSALAGILGALETFGFFSQGVTELPELRRSPP